MKIEEIYDLFLQNPIITTDSRDCPVGSMFFALKGDNFNGNKFAITALEKGCAYAVVDEEPAALADASTHDIETVAALSKRLILVDDALTTLQQLAHLHRKHFSKPVIQITGTNGKTTTKELVSTVLAQKYNVLYTQGNLNNHIGVPKTLLRLTDEHDIAIIETGANHPGEIAALAEIVDPDCGLITNVGVAHIEGFGSFDGVVKTKGELYDFLRHKAAAGRGSGEIFLNADNPHLAKIAQGLHAITYGSPGNGYNVEGEVAECAPLLKVRWRTKNTSEFLSKNELSSEQYNATHEVQTHLIGAYNLDNVLAAICVGLRFGVEPAQIDAALTNYVPTNNRSELRETAHNTLIVDAYNANPSSMVAALDNFALAVSPHGREKMLILGEMRELGDISATEHANIIKILQTKFMEPSSATKDNIWLVGANFQSLNPPFRTFLSVAEVKAELNSAPVRDKFILIKGSNGTRLFELPDYL